MLYLKIIIILLIFLAGLHFYLNNNGLNLYGIEGMTSDMNSNSNSNKTSTCPDMLIQHGVRFYLYNSKLAKVPGVNPIEFNNLEEYNAFTKWQRIEGLRCPILYLQHSYNTQGESTYKIRPNVNEISGGLPSSMPSRETSLMPSGEPLKQGTQPSTSSQKQFSQGNPMASTPTSAFDQQTPPPVNDSNTSYNMPSKSGSSDSSDSSGSSGSSESYDFNNEKISLVDAGRDDLPYNTNSLPAHDPSSFYLGKTTPLDIMDQREEQLLHSGDPMNPNWGGADYTQHLVDTGYYAGNEVSIRIA